MKLLVASVLFALLAVCTVSVQAEETFLSNGIDYFKELASDVSSKATDAINQVKEMPLAQTAMNAYDQALENISSFYTSALDIASEKWAQLTKQF